MSLVYLVAMKSKDELTHIGAVIIGPDHEIRSTGYNSFVRGINDNIPERQKKPEKFYWFAHAEQNSIYNAARMGLSLKNCIMYTNGIPCTDCAIGVIQSGIKEIVVHKVWNDNNGKKWGESAQRSLIMFKEANVNIRYYNGDLITEISGYRRGKKLKL